MNALGESAGALFGLEPATALRLLATIAVVHGLTLLRWLALVALSRRALDPRDRYRWGAGITYAAFFLAVVLATRIWVVNFGGFATYLGLVSAGVAIALKDPLTDLAAWLFILWRRPLEVGDRDSQGINHLDWAGRRFRAHVLEVLRRLAGSDQEYREDVRELLDIDPSWHCSPMTLSGGSPPACWCPRLPLRAPPPNEAASGS